MAVMRLVVLDSLYDDLEVERAAARDRGVVLNAWEGGADVLAQADCVVHVRTRVDRELIASMPRCRTIGRFGSGLDTVDLEAAQRAGIRVVSVSDYCIPELPTHTLALAFALQRRLGEIAGLGASWAAVALATPLHRRACAVIVGLGAVGRRVAAALVALGYEVIVVTRTAALAADAGFEPTPLEEALPRADMLFLLTALDESTRGLLNEARLAALKSGALVIDTARLDLLDEAAVAGALRSGRVGGLALDARLAADSPLAAFAGDPRVIVSPHIGWYSEESAAELRRRGVLQTIDATETESPTTA